jgi:hypothetical protein
MLAICEISSCIRQIMLAICQISSCICQISFAISQIATVFSQISLAICQIATAICQISVAISGKTIAICQISLAISQIATGFCPISAGIWQVPYDICHGAQAAGVDCRGGPVCPPLFVASPTCDLANQGGRAGPPLQPVRALACAPSRAYSCCRDSSAVNGCSVPSTWPQSSSEWKFKSVPENMKELKPLK